MRDDLMQFLKYGLVGFSGTLAHYLWLISLVNLYTGVAPVFFAFSGAFLGAVVNYALNYRFTFVSSKRHSLAFSSFAMLSVLSMLVSGAVVQLFVRANAHYLLGQFFATGLCVPLGFVISKKVVF